MGFFQRLFARLKADPTPPPAPAPARQPPIDAAIRAIAHASAVTLTVADHRSGLMSVVGESHYQDALRALVTQHRDRVCEIAIEAEPTNGYDPNAVRICTLQGATLGYLRRPIAAEYATFFQHHGPMRLTAELTGGRPDAPSIGIVLRFTPARDASVAWYTAQKNQPR